MFAQSNALSRTSLIIAAVLFLTPSVFAADWILERRDTPGTGVTGVPNRASGVRIFVDGKVTEYNDNTGKENLLVTLGPSLLSALQKFVDAVPASSLVAKKSNPCPDKGIFEYRFKKTAGKPTVFFKDDFCRISELTTPAPEKLKGTLDHLSDLRAILVPEF